MRTSRKQPTATGMTAILRWSICGGVFAPALAPVHVPELAPAGASQSRAWRLASKRNETVTEI